MELTRTPAQARTCALPACGKQFIVPYPRSSKQRYCSVSCGQRSRGDREGPNNPAWRPVQARFWPKVRFTRSCWLWTGMTNDKGYGKFRYAPKRLRPAHVVAYELIIGPVPAGLELDHTCRVRACVRPDHLEPVTHAENIRRRVSRTYDGSKP